MIILILALKCYFTVLSQDLAEQEMGDLRETQAHLTTQLVATQGRVEKRLTHWMRNSSLDRRKLELDLHFSVQQTPSNRGS